MRGSPASWRGGRPKRQDGVEDAGVNDESGRIGLVESDLGRADAPGQGAAGAANWKSSQLLAKVAP